MLVAHAGVIARRPVAQVLWTPLVLGSALVAWWDPTQGVTLSGSNVTSWKDRAGGLAATQATAANQPTVVTQNSLTALLFSGSMQLAATTPLNLPTNSDVFAVVQFNATGSQHRYLSQAQSGPEPSNGFFLRQDGSSYTGVSGGGTSNTVTVLPSTYTISSNGCIIDDVVAADSGTNMNS